MFQGHPLSHLFKVCNARIGFKNAADISTLTSGFVLWYFYATFIKMSVTNCIAVYCYMYPVHLLDIWLHILKFVLLCWVLHVLHVRKSASLLPTNRNYVFVLGIYLFILGIKHYDVYLVRGLDSSVSRVPAVS